ncbi:MAG TPA: hypothetical protein VG426_04650 [Candidatus Dormibacteraeota bacterium]|jgi:hypothetical protein|nr:hypothetical protein [Candidatus Dormibacteraeota bacterium]
MDKKKRDKVSTKKATEVPSEAQEDLELADEDAQRVKGGRKAGKGQQEFLVVKMNDVIITG